MIESEDIAAIRDGGRSYLHASAYRERFCGEVPHRGGSRNEAYYAAMQHSIVPIMRLIG